jgi:iron complex outermembrane recepter protein
MVNLFSTSGYIILVVILNFPLNSVAEKQNEIQTATDTTLNDTGLVHRLDEVVVSAFDRSQLLIEVPASISYVNIEIFEREKPAYNLIPVLNYVPGIFAHSGAINTSRITIRGIGARVPYATGKIRAYLNNIPLTNTSGISFIEDIDPSIIESMKVIKGPATSVYGAGLGGTISLRARQPFARDSRISNNSQFGSFGLFRNSFNIDLAGENSAGSLVYSHTQSEGYRENNEFRRDALTSVSQFRLSDNSNLTTLLSFSDLKSHIPSSIDSHSFENNPRSADKGWLNTKGYEASNRFMGGLSAATDFSESISAELSLFSIWHDEKEMRPFDVFYEKRFTMGTRLKTSYLTYFENAELKLTAGGEAFSEAYSYSNYENIDGTGIQGDRFSNNKEDVFTYNIFLQTDAGINRWNLSAGLNLNYTHIDYIDLIRDGMDDRSGQYDYGFILSPRISLGYRFYERNAVYLTFSHGFSPPSLSETLTPEGYINPDIRPEKSWNLESGIRGKILDKRLFYDLTVYSMQVEDLLVAERVGPDAWVGKNAGESLHQGIETELHWMILYNRTTGSFGLKDLSLRANYTFNHFRFTDFRDLDDDYSGNKIPGVPNHILFATLYKKLSVGIYTQLSYRFVGSMPMNDENTKYSDSYQLVDLRIGYETRIGDNLGMDVYFSAKNLFNEHYASMILVNAPSFGDAPPRYYYPGLPLNFEAGIRIGYSL